MAASPDDVPDTGMPGDALMRAKGIEGGWGGVAGGDGIADVMLGLPDWNPLQWSTGIS